MKLPLLALLLGLASCQSAGMGEARRDDARREAYLAAHPETDWFVAAAIRAGECQVGMTTEEVVAALGEPSRIIRARDREGQSWIMRRKRVEFTDGRVSAVSPHPEPEDWEDEDEDDSITIWFW